MVTNRPQSAVDKLQTNVERIITKKVSQTTPNNISQKPTSPSPAPTQSPQPVLIKNTLFEKPKPSSFVNTLSRLAHANPLQVTSIKLTEKPATVVKQYKVNPPLGSNNIFPNKTSTHNKPKTPDKNTPNIVAKAASNNRTLPIDKNTSNNKVITTDSNKTTDKNSNIQNIAILQNSDNAILKAKIDILRNVTLKTQEIKENVVKKFSNTLKLIGSTNIIHGEKDSDVTSSKTAAKTESTKIAENKSIILKKHEANAITKTLENTDTNEIKKAQEATKVPDTAQNKQNPLIKPVVDNKTTVKTDEIKFTKVENVQQNAQTKLQNSESKQASDKKEEAAKIYQEVNAKNSKLVENLNKVSSKNNNENAESSKILQDVNAKNIISNNESKTIEIPRSTAATLNANIDALVSNKLLIQKQPYPISKVDVEFDTSVGNFMETSNIFIDLKEKVIKASNEYKTFTVVGNYYSIRNALLARGWVEKLRLSEKTYGYPELKELDGKTIEDLLDCARSNEHGYNVQRTIMSKMLGRHQVDLYWDLGILPWEDQKNPNKLTILSTIKKVGSSYSSKLGLCEGSKQIYWYQIPQVSDLYHPRTYSLYENVDTKQLIEDFRLTSCISLLEWIVQCDEKTIPKLISSAGKVPLEAFQFAIRGVTRYIREYLHEDIDTTLQEPEEYQWNDFLEHYYKLVHIGNHFMESGLECEDTLAHKSKYILRQVEKYFPERIYDGIMNVWLLKPVGGGMGIGIHICQTLEFILKIVNENKNKKYVIQKYIGKLH